MTQRHPETAVGEWWGKKCTDSGDACGVLFRSREEGPVKGPATGEKGASHGPLCMNARASRPVFPASAIILLSHAFSLPRSACCHPVGMFVFVCVPLSLFITSVAIHSTLHRLRTCNHKSLCNYKLGTKTVSPSVQLHTHTIWRDNFFILTTTISQTNQSFHGQENINESK